MVVNQRVTGRATSMPAGIGVGLLASIFLTVAGSAIVSLLISRETIQENGIGYGAILILLLSSSVGALAAWRCIRHQRVIVCMIHGLCYYLVLLGFTALFFGGQYQGMGVTALVILAGCGTIGLLGLSGGKKGNRKIKKMLPR